MKDNKNISRKSFIKKAGLGTLASASILSACGNDNKTTTDGAPNIITGKKYRWKMVTTWPPNFPVLGELCNYFSEWVKEMSGGRMEIKVYGGGELVPALEVFEAVSSGTVEMGHGASYYWSGKAPSAPFFTTIPFGMNAQQVNAWLYCGGGLELYKELYDRYSLIPMPGGNTGVQMGGWYNKEINTLEDFRGLKMRIPGLGGKVIEKAGGSAILCAGSEIYTNLERGVIDATEWIGPYHDYKMGFYKIAKYYYAPGWHETGANLEFIFNKFAFEKLPKDLQLIMETAAYRANLWSLSEFEAKNNFYLNKLINEEEVEMRRFSVETMQKMKGFMDEVLEELTTEDAFSAKVYEAYNNFKQGISNWSTYSEQLYYNTIQGS